MADASLVVSKQDARMRTALAIGLVVVGVLAIVSIGVTCICLDPYQADKVFTAILGVAGTWISTVLVFYFGKENFQAAQTANQQAQKALTDAVQASGEAQVKTVTAIQTANTKVDSSLSAAMTSLEKLKTIDLTGDSPEASLTVDHLCEVLSAQEYPVVLLHDGVALYVVHNSSVFRFIADRARNGAPVVMAVDAAGAAPTTFDAMVAETLKNGPNTGKTYGDVMKTFLTLAQTTTLSAAKTALATTVGAQDIVVTPTGDAAGKMLGLVTSADIAQIVTS